VKRRRLLFMEGALRHALGGTSATVLRPDGVECHDGGTVPAPPLVADFDGEGLAMQLGTQEDNGAGVDVLRTGCPGPMQSDMLGRAPVASGSLPLSTFARRRLELTMTGGGRFRSVGYAGTHRSRFTLTLRRETLRVNYSHVRVGR
jgi:hypothetical protein